MTYLWNLFSYNSNYMYIILLCMVCNHKNIVRSFIQMRNSVIIHVSARAGKQRINEWYNNNKNYDHMQGWRKLFISDQAKLYPEHQLFY